MKSERAISFELKRIEKVIKQKALSELDVREQFGAQQALGWVLEMDCMAPSKLATLGEGR